MLSNNNNTFNLVKMHSSRNQVKWFSLRLNSFIHLPHKPNITCIFPNKPIMVNFCCQHLLTNLYNNHHPRDSVMRTFTSLNKLLNSNNSFQVNSHNLKEVIRPSYLVLCSMLLRHLNNSLSKLFSILIQMLSCNSNNHLTAPNRQISYLLQMRKCQKIIVRP